MIDLDMLDARGRRPVAERALESLDRLGLAFGLRLDAAVGQIADPAVQPLMRRGGFGEPAEADALHAACDQISTSDAHGGS